MIWFKLLNMLADFLTFARAQNTAGALASATTEPRNTAKTYNCLTKYLSLTMTNYIHFEDGRDVAKMESYIFNGQQRYVYHYGVFVIVSPRKLTKEQLSAKIRQKEINAKTLHK